MENIDYKQKLYALIASATISDHMGDMWEDIYKVLKDIGDTELIDADRDYDDEEGRTEFDKILNARGVKTVWDTEV